MNEENNKAPLSEIDQFKKQLEEGIIPPYESANEKPLRRNSTPVIIFCCIIACIAVFAVGYLIGMNAGLNNKDRCEEYAPIKDEKDDKDDNSIKDVIIDDSIKEIYNLYHTENASISPMDMEYLMYKEDSFRVSDMTYVPSSIVNKLVEKATKEIDEKTKIDTTNNSKYLEKEDGETIIKKYLKEFFGDNLEYKDSLFSEGCRSLFLENDKFIINYVCGDLSSGTYEYKLIKAEKDNKYLYLTEEVTIKETEKSIVVKTFKWTLNKDDNGNYYLVRSDRQAN